MTLVEEVAHFNEAAWKERLYKQSWTKGCNYVTSSCCFQLGNASLHMDKSSQNVVFFLKYCFLNCARLCQFIILMATNDFQTFLVNLSHYNNPKNQEEIRDTGPSVPVQLIKIILSNFIWLVSKTPDHRIKRAYATTLRRLICDGFSLSKATRGQALGATSAQMWSSITETSLALLLQKITPGIWDHPSLCVSSLLPVAASGTDDSLDWVMANRLIIDTQSQISFMSRDSPGGCRSLWVVKGSKCKMMCGRIKMFSCKKREVKWQRWELHRAYTVPLRKHASHEESKVFSCPLCPGSIWNSPLMLVSISPHRPAAGITSANNHEFFVFLQIVPETDKFLNTVGLGAPPLLFFISPSCFCCEVFVPGWHSRHTGWGHTGQEDPEVQACLQSRGFLALPVLQLVRGSRLYCNQEYQLDLRVRTDGHLGATESYTLSSGTLNIYLETNNVLTTIILRKPLHPGQSNYDSK